MTTYHTDLEYGVFIDRTASGFGFGLLSTWGTRARAEVEVKLLSSHTQGPLFVKVRTVQKSDWQEIPAEKTERPHNVTAIPRPGGHWEHRCADCGAVTFDVAPALPCTPAETTDGAR